MQAQTFFDASRFREEVRVFCSERMPAALARKAASYAYFTKDDRICWQQLLQDRGWFAGHWPRNHGGQDWSALQRFILLEELEYAGTPWLTHFGISFAGPLIYTFGTTEQQERLLPGIRDSTTWWCQGFSEPSAGSDLASVGTRARCEGDHYIVNGHKTWITMAHWADMMFALVRTGDDGPRQGNLSLLLIDMASPGVTIRTIPTIDARVHINDVFLDDVRVPIQNRVGDAGQGWACAKFVVNNERVLVTELGKARRYFDALKSIAASDDSRGQRLRATGGFRRRLAELELQLECLRALAYAAMATAESGRTAAVDSSVLKIRGSQVQQALLEAIVESIGLHGLPAPSAGDNEDHSLIGGLLAEHLYSRASSIYGGSNEIQANIIARAVLDR